VQRIVDECPIAIGRKAQVPVADERDNWSMLRGQSGSGVRRAEPLSVDLLDGAAIKPP
jgi:hypothetical protein